MSEVVKIKGVGPVLAAECAKAGFGNVMQIAGAKVSELAVIRGVGELRAKSLISAARSLLGDIAPSKPASPKRTKPKKDKKKKKKSDKKNKNNKAKKKKKKKSKK